MHVLNRFQHADLLWIGSHFQRQEWHIRSEPFANVSRSDKVCFEEPKGVN